MQLQAALEPFSFLIEEYGFTRFEGVDERVLFVMPQFRVELIAHDGKLVVAVRRPYAPGNPHGTVLLKEIVEILGRASPADRLALERGQDPDRQAALLRRYCEPMLRGDLSLWEHLLQTVAREFLNAYQQAVRDALHPVLERFALSEKPAPLPEVLLFRGEHSSLCVILDGPCVGFSIAEGHPVWTEDGWFDLQDIVAFQRRRLECGSGSISHVFRYDAMGYVRKQLDRLVPQFRDYCEELLRGDFSAAPEMREFLRDRCIYARTHGWFVDPLWVDAMLLLPRCAQLPR